MAEHVAQIKIPAVITVAAHPKAFFSNSATCPPLHGNRVGRAIKSCCALSAAPTSTANRSTVSATVLLPPAKL